MDSIVAEITDVGAITTRSLPPILVMEAEGRVPTLGWTNARLSPAVYIVPPEDGIWDFTLLAQTPDESGFGRPSKLRANIALEMPRWCKGVRVHSATNSVEVDLLGASETRATPAPVNWVPYPWGKRGLVPAAVVDDPDSWPWSVPVHVLKELESLPEFPDGDVGGSLSDSISSLVGRTVRVFHEGDIITMDYRRDRLNIELVAGSQRVKRVLFG